MQKFTLSAVFIFLLSLGLSAQETNWCATDDKYQEALEENPQLEQIYKDNWKEIQNIIKYGNTKDDDDEILIIPVVFHVLHEYGNENISDEQIFDAIHILNRDFAKLNPDTVDIIPDFVDIAAATKIEFRLATKDPNGNCTNGINRIPTAMTNYGYDPLSKVVRWPRAKYLNIWVCKDMNNPGVAGYAYLPSYEPSPLIDGIMVRSNYVGSIGTSNAYRSRTITHEVGHYLNLPHVWGSGEVGTECGDDGIEDTPITKGWNYCPNASDSDVCEPGVYENFQNYMDYSYCDNMFTPGQVEVMRATLHSNMAQRSNLITSQNHIETGVLESTECAPIVDFYAEKNLRTVCVGQNVNFIANITNAGANSYSWSFPGANVESSTSASQIVKYSTPGWKKVVLTAGNDQGSGTKTKEQAIYVMDSSIDLPHFSETFTSSSIESKWIIPELDNTIAGGVNWSWSSVGALDAGSLKLNIFDNPSRESFEVFSPKLNLTGKQGQFVSFKYAFATQKINPNNVDVVFEVLSTIDCGKSKITKFKLDEPGDLLTGGNFAQIEFVPTPELWRTAVFQIDNAIALDGVQFVFRVRADYQENNFYIDDINVGDWIVSTDNDEIVHNLNLYPNPTKDITRLDFTLIGNSMIEIAVFDLTGKVVKSIEPQNYTTGLNNVEINTSDLAAGAYIVQMSGTEVNKSLKLLITK